MASQPLSPPEPESEQDSSSRTRPSFGTPTRDEFVWPWFAGVAAAVVVLALLGVALRMARTVNSQPPQVSVPQPAVREPAPKSAIGVPAPTPASKLPEMATLKLLRYSSQPAFTAIELELDRPVAVRANVLYDPERVYFDLSDTSIAATLNPTGTGTFKLPLGVGLVQRIRIAKKSESSIRVVLDLSQSCRYGFIMSQSPPYRLVIEVEL